MGLLFGQPQTSKSERVANLFGVTSPADLIPRRVPGKPGMYVDENTAMRHSAVWSSLRLRADLISTLPRHVFRDFQNQRYEVTVPPVLISPSGDNVSFGEWLYISQVELDRSGNAVGVIKEANSNGLPARIDLVPSSAVSIVMSNGSLAGYRIEGTLYTPDKVWHERQYPVAGMPWGLSPVQHAMWALQEQLAVQDFVTGWFTSGATPRARLRNVEREVPPKEAAIVKETWRAAVALGEPFVHGSDWEYSLMSAEQATAQWLDAMKFNTVDIARFFGCPADLIDAAVSGESITYANISQRNLQFLIMNLGPAIMRREESISRLLPRPRYLKMDTNALLRMDPATRAEMLRIQIESRQICPSEARAEDDRPPYTKEQMAEFDRFWPPAQPKSPPYSL